MLYFLTDKWAAKANNVKKGSDGNWDSVGPTFVGRHPILFLLHFFSLLSLQLFLIIWITYY